MLSRISKLLKSDETGFTLVEVLVATVIGLMITLAAFTLLEFSTRDVSRITDRAHADQVGRVALENVMLQLHSACVAVGVNPVQAGSNANELIFISEVSSLNKVTNEPVSVLSTVQLHKLIYTEGKLTEKSWTGKFNATLTHESTRGPYEFNEAEKPAEKVLLKGISPISKLHPIFQYFRYYKEGDAEPKYGQLNPTAITPASEAVAETVAKVTMGFVLTPEGVESSFARGDRAVTLEDSAILRLTPSTEAPNIINQPCTQVVT
jgi:type II secretory pathway component PulJ